ncbi:MucR family transcriptional regulator [Vreelandella venusta]|uniref:MucR family transcriptional regulator n=1 Tax=Vreelandella venusta TaxID=44935 RepID=UPI00200DE425|nr:MucR family transcriptional regulator [Halomonas venusta]UQI41913.1 MucR family transcriptional regulator [Halomonas venusta]
MRDTPFETNEELEAYTGGPQIQCLECGKWFKSLATHLPRTHGMSHAEYRQKWGIPKRFALAGTATREKLSEQLKEAISKGKFTYDHLDSAVEAARTAGRGQKTPLDKKRQSEMVSTIRPGDHSILPSGSKRADGRDADRAREYQKQRRAQTKPKWSESPERRKEANEAWLALQEGDPMPLFRYTIRYDTYIQFTRDEDEIIKQHYPDWGALRVGMLLKRKPESIRARAQVLGVSNKSPQAKSHSYRWDRSNDPRLINMVEKRATQKEIADHFGTSVTTIAAQVKRLKIKKPRA